MDQPHKLPAAEPSRSPAPLLRCLRPAGVLFLTLSATTPASSVFVIVPGMLRVASSGALWALLLAGVVCVATAFLYAELSSAWPVAGGEYVMVARTLGPLPGFVVLGVNVVNNLLFPPTVALGVSDVLARAWPGLAPVPVAIGVVLASTAVALLNIRVNAWVTGLFLAVELAALAVLVWAGLAHPARGLGALLGDPVPGGMTSLGVAAVIALFAFNGYGMAVYFGEELHEAPRRIARVILWALGLTLLCEIVPVAAALVGAPSLSTLFAAADPFGALVSARGGERLGRWVAAAVAIAILNAAIVTILACARFFYATGRDGAWGRRLDALLVAVHPRLGSPWAATLLIGAVGVGCCFMSVDRLLVLSGAGLVVTYAALALAALVGRRGPTAHAPYRMPLFPLAPVVTLAALGYVTWTSWSDLTEGRPGLIATAAQIVAAALYYVLVLRRRGDWIVRDPVDVAAPPMALEASRASRV